MFVDVLRDTVIDPESLRVGYSDTMQALLASFAGGPILPDACPLSTWSCAWETAESHINQHLEQHRHHGFL